MKPFLLLILIVSGFNLTAQHLNYTEISSHSNGDTFTSYTGSSGITFNVGDTVTIGVPSSNKTFAFVYLGTSPASVSYSGYKAKIKKIIVYGTSRMGYKVGLKCAGPSAFANYNIDLESAINSAEIKTNVMTSDQALAELKKCKDKLDLGLMTPEDYQKKKDELSKFIK